MSASGKRRATKGFNPPAKVAKPTPAPSPEALALEGAFNTSPWPTDQVPAPIQHAIVRQLALIDLNKHPDLCNGRRRNCLRPGVLEATSFVIGTSANPQTAASEDSKPVPRAVQELTRDEPFKTLHALLARLIKLQDPLFLYETITININFRCAWHRDTGNRGDSYIIVPARSRRPPR